MPNCAFCVGIQLLAEFESSSMGMGWGSIFLEVDNVSMGLVLAMLLVDTVGLTFIGWYLDHVLPKEFGVQQKPWFLFTRSFWCNAPDEDGAQFDGASAKEPASNGSVEASTTARRQLVDSGRCIRLEHCPPHPLAKIAPTHPHTKSCSYGEFVR
jgi:hypothetical protein